ncbi:Protein of unknown function [Bacillus wiedmannii]|uniref:Uncharacterized protein n=2 Tax=Bacillus cereus group TaxID=86661 RepID=A0A1C4BIW9_9BACI|nr:Protein of unknown function [Bacillus mobilis]SCC13227.1 Protein of unknown function [Bacillus wiedmannii]SCC16676.1 Protein of unknown function [Bacillus wiedmannii]SCC17161.1 Protein of unknown function [Bacillus thuringiensis]SCM94328.1 Protein of unknown function [Bacillus cereus]
MSMKLDERKYCRNR